MKKKIICVSVGLLLAGSGMVRAATATWDGPVAPATGTTEGSWLTAINWVGDATPTFNNTLDITYTYGGLSWIGNQNPTIRSLTFTDAVDTDLNLRTLNNGNIGAKTLTIGGAGGAAINIDTGATGNINIGQGSNGGPIVLAEDLAISHNGSGNLSFLKRIQGDGGIVKNGAGALVLAVSNVYAGVTVLNAGTLSLNDNNALGTGNFTINGGTITSTGKTLANAVTINGDFAVAGNTGVTVPIFTGDVSLGTAAGTSRTITATAANSGTGQPAFQGVISDGTTANKIVKKGTGGLLLQGANLFTGGVDLDEGVLIANHNSALGTGTLSISNATTLSVAGVQVKTLANQVVVKGDFTLGLSSKAVLTLSGAMDLGGSTRTITIGNANGDVISGNISNGGVVKDGDGALTLSGANTYAGGTTVSLGALIGGSDNAFGTGGLSIGSGAMLVLTNGVSNDYIDDLATLALDGSASLSLDFTGVADTVGGISLDGGTTWLTAGTYDAAALSGLGAGTYTGTGMLTVIPEPAALGLVMALGSGLLWIRRVFMV